MVSVTLWSVMAWTLKGLLCAWRFFWVSPYHSISTFPRGLPESGAAQNPQPEDLPGSESQESSHHHIHSNIVQKRLSKAEEEIHLLKSQLATERVSWERKFTMLQRKQQELRDQLSSETFARARVFLDDDDDDDDECGENFVGSEVQSSYFFAERDQLSFGGARPQHQGTGSSLGSQTSLLASLGSRSPSASSMRISVASSRSTPHRAFVPHSHLDLQIGHRVRVLLPSGRISTGTVRYLGALVGGEDFCMGVELELPERGLEDGTYEGQSYFKCKPGHGAFVAFSKLLMAWE